MIDEDGNVVHEVRLPQPVDRVWQAMVDPAGLAQWLSMPNDFEARVGHRFRLDAGPPRGFIEAEVLDLDPPRRMQWSWIIDDVPTTITITLRPDGDGTVVSLVHSDLPRDPRPRFESGWVEKLDSLRTLLEGAP